MMLCEKYRANCFSDIKGQELAIEKLQAFLEDFPRKKALILNGPPGTGKTTLAYSLALEYKSEIIEVNASDFRDKINIDRIVGQASQQASLTNKSKIILVDEVDGVSTEDRGGLPELVRLIEITSFPIILTSNNIWNKKFSELRKKSEIIELKEINYKVVFNILKEIAIKEKLEIDDNLLMSIAIKARGDIRAALNDLQTSSPETSHDSLAERDKEEKIFNVLKKVFKNIPTAETLGFYDKVNMPIDEIFLWLEENIPLEYKNEELFKAYDALSKADVFRGRIHRQQHWRFLVYENFLLSVGVSASKKKDKFGFTSYKRPTRVLKIWMMNQKNILKKSIARKYASYCHVGLKRAMKEFPIFKPILKNEQIQRELKLTEDEVGFLMN